MAVPMLCSLVPHWTDSRQCGLAPHWPAFWLCELVPQWAVTIVNAVKLQRSISPFMGSLYPMCPSSLAASL